VKIEKTKVIKELEEYDRKSSATIQGIKKVIETTSNEIKVLQEGNQKIL